MRPRDIRNYTPEQRCQMKRVYYSWEEGEKAALLLIDDVRDGLVKNHKPKTVIVGYLCDYCERWHVGHIVKPPNPFNCWMSAIISYEKAKAWNKSSNKNLRKRIFSVKVRD